MIYNGKEDIILRNEQLTIAISPSGGAIVSLQHRSALTNPLNFYYKEPGLQRRSFCGHFICTPRWGDVSPAEQEKGLVKHGDFRSLEWQIEAQTDTMLTMQSYSEAEQWMVKRTMRLASQSPVFYVQEKLMNCSSARRAYNLVQHPTIAVPFLHAATRVDCNGTEGWRDNGIGNLPTTVGAWPAVINQQGQATDIRMATPADGGVYSFATGDAITGWLSAYDPHSGLLLGYVWPAQDYPFIHHWVHAEKDQVIYRGLEFGTAAMHQPFSVQEDNEFCWQQQPTCRFLDGGATATFQYYGLLTPVDNAIEGIKQLNYDQQSVYVHPEGEETIYSLSIH